MYLKQFFIWETKEINLYKGSRVYIHDFIQTLSLAKKLAQDCYVQACHHKVHVPAEIMTTKNKDKIQYVSKSLLEITDGHLTLIVQPNFENVPPTSHYDPTR